MRPDIEVMSWHKTDMSDLVFKIRALKEIKFDFKIFLMSGFFWLEYDPILIIN